MVRSLAFALSLVLVLVVAASAAGEPIRIRAGEHRDYGRIVFDWTQRVDYRAALADRTLTVTFARPFEAGFASVMRHLDDYVAAARRSEDGTRSEFELKRDVTLRQQRIGAAVVIDLVDRAAAAAPTAGDSRGLVRVRAGIHPGFGRLVFDWRRRIDYTVSRAGDAVRIGFSRPTRFDLSRPTRRPPPYVVGLSPTGGDAAGTLEIKIAPGARIRHFRDGTKVVLDVLKPRIGPRPPTPRTVAATTAPTRKPEPSAKPPAPAGAPLDLTPAQSRGQAAIALGDGQTVTLPEAGALKAPAKPAAPPARPVQPAPSAKPKAPNIGKDGLEQVIAEYARGADTETLRFAWTKPVPAAVYRRGAQVWIVFDRPGRIDLRAVRRDGAIRAIEQMNHRLVTILRIAAAGDSQPRASREQAAWTITLSDRQAPPASPLAAVTRGGGGGDGAGDGPRIFVPVIDAGQRIAVFDPEIGDEVTVVPVLPSGHGLAVDREFVEFRALRTAQGIVVEPRIDDLEIATKRNGVIIGAPGGLAVSPVEFTRAARKTRGYAASMKPPILDFETWRGGPAAKFLDRKQSLLRALARSPRGGRNVARWELAKFHFAHGFAADAGSLIYLIELDEPDAVRDPVFRAVRGIVRVLGRRWPGAEEDLLNSGLKLYPDVALWRGVLLTQKRDYGAALTSFSQGAALLYDLPFRLREKVLLAWAQAAVEANDASAFQVVVDGLKELPPSDRIRSTIALLNGRMAEAENRPDDALDLYAAAKAIDYRPTRARAAYRATDLSFRLNEIDADTAIDRYEALRFGWRGDELELNVLRNLARLHFSKGEYGTGLGLLRHAISYFPPSPEIAAMTKDMNATFGELFLGDRAGELSPVRALALYYDFQELTPAGQQGDEVIRRLADRLANVDLLDRAGRLLQHQVTYRLRGAEKARVATRLAVIQLLAKKPEEALKALRDSAWKTLPDDLARERRHLEARALFDLGRIDQAVALLNGDDSLAARRLRADMFWRTERWADAAAAITRLIGALWQDARPLSEAEQTQVVQLAVSLYMADDRPGLSRLRQRFGSAMAEGRHAETLKLLTRTVDPAKTEFRQLANAIAGVDQLEAFMAGYRDKVAEGQLSAIN